MTVLITPTPRRKMTRQRAAKIFLREQGRCYICNKRLRIGVDGYQIEHPDPLCLGGSDDDADLRVICTECHKAKSAQDIAAKAKRDRIVTAGYRPEGERRSKIVSPGFRRVQKQRRASTPVQPKFEGDILARKGQP